MEKNGTLASPAMAFASSVLPVPGEPTISTPRGILPPNFWNLGRIAQEFDQLADFLFRLVHARDVGEGDLHFVLALQLGARAANDIAPRPPPPDCSLAHEEDEDADEQDVRQHVDEDVEQRRAGGGRRLLDGDVVLDQVVDQILVAQVVGGELAAIAALAIDGGRGPRRW